MEMFKQILKNNQVELGDLVELNKIFNILGNQQEQKNIFKEVNHYLSDLNSNFSVWELKNSGILENVWLKKNYDSENENKLENIRKILLKNKKIKKPIIEKSDEVYAIIPIIAREEVIGFLCIDEVFEDKEEWKKIYTVVQIFGFSFKYYEMIEMMKDLSIVDLMTGLFNHRHFRFQINLEVEKANRFKKPLSLVFVKIKDFDEIHKKLGFNGGEVVLKEFAKILKRQVRSTDMPARINDETFAILMYEANEEGAKKFIERLEKILAVKKIEVEDNEFNIELDYKIQEYKKTTTSEEFFEMAKK